MPYVITEACISVKDKSCVDVCPVSCIYLENDEVDRKLYIHPDECIECGACEPECPVSAIFHESAVPDEWKEFTALNAEEAPKCPVITEKKAALEGESCSGKK